MLLWGIHYHYFQLTVFRVRQRTRPPCYLRAVLYYKELESLTSIRSHHTDPSGNPHGASVVQVVLYTKVRRAPGPHITLFSFSALPRLN